MAERDEGSRSALLAAALLVAGLSVSALASHREPPAQAPVRLVSTAAAHRQVEPAGQARALREGRALDLNRATADDLRLLPGIGPMLAARIVSHRSQVGRFARVQDLDAVPGIGPKTLQRVTPLLTVDVDRARAPRLTTGTASPPTD